MRNVILLSMQLQAMTQVELFSVGPQKQGLAVCGSNLLQILAHHVIKTSA